MLGSLLRIVEEQDLEDCIGWLLDNNASQGLPYHNFQHACWVAEYAETCYLFEHGGCKPPKELILAALFHDFGHSGGVAASDRHNVLAAVDGFRRWAQTAKTAELSPQMVELTVFLIKCTEYPHDMTVYESTNAQTCFLVDCLRDADMAQNLNVTLVGNVVGIKQELFRGQSWPEYLRNTVKFMEGIQYRTLFGQMCLEPKRRETADLLRSWADLIWPDGEAAQE